MPMPSMSKKDFITAQQRLRLTDLDCAHLLGYEHAQHVQRLKKPESDRYAKSITPTASLLMQAYLSGYRPNNWPLYALSASNTSGEICWEQIRDILFLVKELQIKLENELSNR